MITSPTNPKLTLARVLQQRRRREREGLFVTEGEDLLDAGRAAGGEPVALLSAAGSGLGGLEVAVEALGSASVLGSGTRVLAIWALPEWDRPLADGRFFVYLHGIADPGNVGTILRSADALLAATVVLGPGCADPYGPKALRSTMGSIFARPPFRAGIATTPEPRAALSAHGGSPISAGIGRLLEVAGGGSLTLCLGAERHGLPGTVTEHCAEVITIGLRGQAESLNVAAAAAIALQGISSAAFGDLPDG